MGDFSELLDDDFNISENLFDDFIQDLKEDTTNYQNLNSDGLNFPDLLGGDGLLGTFDDPGMFDLFANFPTEAETTSATKSIDQQKPLKYPNVDPPVTIAHSLLTQPQYKKQHILSTGTAFVTDTAPVVIPRPKSLPYTITNPASYSSAIEAEIASDNRNSPTQFSNYTVLTNFNLASFQAHGHAGVVKSSSSKSHKKQKTFMSEEGFSARSAPLTSVTSEYFLGDVPVVSGVLPMFNGMIMPVTIPPLKQKHPLTKFPITIFQAFNAGDITKVEELITENTLKTCCLRTPSLDHDHIGQKYVIDFFQAVYDAHPDAILVAKKCKYISAQQQVECRVYFAGTRIMKASLLLPQLHDATFVLQNNDYLFKRRGASLLDEMNISMLGGAEIAAMKELENSGKNLSVFWKGNLALHLTAEGNKIDKVLFDWKVSSFREAGL